MSNSQYSGDDFFNNSTMSGNKPRPPPPPPPPRPGVRNSNIQQTAPSFYSNAAPPPPPPRPMYQQQQQQRQQPHSSDGWFESGSSTQPQQQMNQAPAAGVWYPSPSSAPQQQIQPQQPFQQMSQPQLQQQPSITTFNPNQQVSSETSPSLSGPMSSNTSSSSYKISSDCYEDEPPLLEELGINIPHIFAKSRAVILPIKALMKNNQHLMDDDDDLAGPLVFALLLGGELLLAAKIHFGYIYGFGMFAWLGMSLILNLLSPPDSPVSAWSVMSILGYCLLPVNVLALINIFVRIKSLKVAGTTLACLCIFWCTLSSMRLFERLGLKDQRYLIAYPTMLVYLAFVILTIF